jgi:hypothetical protein
MLRRLCRNVPLPRLLQGSFLTIRSAAPSAELRRPAIPIHVIVEPSWRDSGHVEFQQFFPPNDDGSKMQMVIHQEDETRSLDRCAKVPQVTIDLIPHDDPTTGVAVVSESTKSDVYYEKHVKSLPQTALPNISMDRVMYDDGISTFPFEEGDLEALEDLAPETTRTDYQDGTRHVTSKPAESASSSSYVVVRVQVPEKLNLTCALLHQNGNDSSAVDSSSITVSGKVEGDVKLHLSNGGGDIVVSKLRGHSIHLETGGYGNIYASQVLEAQMLTLHGSFGRIRVKQIHSSVANVTIDQRLRPSVENENMKNDSIHVFGEDNDDEGSLIDISSLFVSGSNEGAMVSVYGNNTNPLQRRAIRIKSNHGPVKVMTTGVRVPSAVNPVTQQLYPIVELGGVNGSCEVSLENSAKYGVTRPNPEWSSSLVHVDCLAPDSVSLVQADLGGISITLDRKTEADLRLTSLMDVERIAAISELLAGENEDSFIVEELRRLPGSTTANEDYDEAAQQKILLETSAFTNRPEMSLFNSSVSFVSGWVENKSAEPDSRFERKIRAPELGGKIRLEGALDQALSAFTNSKENNDLTHNVGNDSKDVLRPLLAVVGTGQIVVETVSWLGAIARRYGLEETGRELGRTATRKGRILSTPDE